MYIERCEKDDTGLRYVSFGKRNGPVRRAAKIGVS
jgi:hypothetical protein